MSDKLSLLLEAEKRGILPADKAPLLAEARKRGLVPGGSDPIWDAAGQLVRGYNRGLNAVISLPNEVMAAGVNAVVPGAGDVFRFNNAVSDFLKSDHAQPQTTAGRYANAIGQQVGASALPAAGLMSQAPRLAALAPTTGLRATGQSVGQSIAAAPGAAVAGDVIASTGAGIAGQAAEDSGASGVTKSVAEVVGALAPGGAALATSRAVQPLRMARARMGEQGAYATVVDDLGMSPEQFRAGVARGDGPGGGALDRREISLAILGEEMVATRGNVVLSGQRTVDRLAQEYGVQPSTARGYVRALTGQYQGSPLFLAEAPSVVAADEALRGPSSRLLPAAHVDIERLNAAPDTQTGAQLDYLANNGNAASATAIRNRIAERQDEMAPLLRERLSNLPNAPVHQDGRRARPATIVDVDHLLDGARRAASQQYQQAIDVQQPFDVRPVLDTFDRSIAGRTSPEAMATRHGVDLFTDPIQTVLPDGRLGPVQIRPVTELSDFINRRTRLNQMIQDSLNPRGGPTAQTIALRRLRQDIDAAVAQSNPGWRAANDAWADMNFDTMARDLGEAFSQRAGPRYREQRAEFERMAPQAQAIVRVHFLQQLYDKLDNLGDTHAVAKLFSTDHARSAIEALFGRQAMVDFVRAVRDIRVAERAKQAVGNSATHRRGIAQRQKDTETGLVAAGSQLNVGGLRNWLLTYAQTALNESRNRPLARILSTPLSDTPQMAMHIERMRLQRDRLSDLARPIPYRAPAATLVGTAVDD